MQSQLSSTGKCLTLTVSLALVGYILVQGISSSIGVDFTAGVTLIFSIVLSVGIIFCAMWNSLTGGLFGYRALLPLALSTLWSGLWPSMNFWGAKSLYLPGMSANNLEVEWWASGYMQWGGSAVLIIFGYGISYYTWRHFNQ